MIKFKELKKNQIKILNDRIISLKDHISIIEQQIIDLKRHQKDMVETYNQHQHSKGSQYTYRTHTPTIYMEYNDD